MSPLTKDRYARQQLFVQPKIQGKILLRVMLYCVFSTLLTTCLVGGLLLPASSAERFYLLGAMALLSLSLSAPLVFFDAARMTHQVVGPIVKSHGRILQRLAGEPGQMLRIRQSDEWQDWTQDFNLLMTQSRQNSPDHEVAE